MSFDSVDLESLRRRRSEKWTEFPRDVLPSHLAEMDFRLAPPIEEVLVAAVQEGDVGYAPARVTALADAFAGFAERHWGWAPDPSAVRAVPDVMVGVAELLRVLTPGDAGVVINPPVYPPFYSVIAETGRRVVEVPLLPPDEPRRLPLDAIRAALRDGARSMLLCNPHNPTGYVAAEHEVRELGAIVNEYGAILLSDEIHAPLAMPGVSHVPAASLVDDAITLMSATKAWNLAGLKCGLAVAQSGRAREALDRLPVDLHDRVGLLGVIASETAFAEGDEWLDELRSYIAETRRRLPDWLGEHAPGVASDPAQATYLAWLDFRSTGLGEDPAAELLDRGRVALLPGPRFGDAGRGFARLNLGTSHELVEESVRRIGSALN